MKTRVALWAVAAIVVLAVAWCYAVPAEWRERVTGPVQQAGWDALVGEQKKEVCNSFGPIELKAKPMATTQVPGNNLSASFTFKHAIWPGMDGSGGYEFSSFVLGCPLIYFTIRSNRDTPGEYSFIVDAAEPLVGVTFTYDLPTSVDDIYWIEIPCSVTVSGNAATRLTSSAVPIGEKGATHAKEHVLTEEWFVPAGTTFTVTIGEQSGEFTTTSDITTQLSLNIHGETLDWDDWSTDAGLEGVKYAMSIEDITFGAAEIDTSTFAATTGVFGTAASNGKLWVEGFGGNSIGFWCSEAFYNGAYVYNDYGGGAISAPFSFDFSNLQFKWMDGTDVDDSLEVYCTGMHPVVDGVVNTALPWHGTIAELKALGRYTQKYGCYYWDTQPPEMQGTVELYLDLNSAEDLGIDIRGPRPEYKVEGAGYGQTIVGETVTAGPYDGQYGKYGTYNGETMYSNGYGFLYCTDPDAGDWAIGPGPPTAPYYVQDGAGPGGSYLVNTDSYTDDIIVEETGQRRFSGLLGEGVGPAASGDTTEGVNSASIGTPSFAHDATFVFDAWPLSATDRTSSPYMTDVVSIAADSDKSVYANAHDHTDWVGVNCTTPDADGKFTVGAGGGSLTLTLKCNYRDRQAKVGGVGEIPVPEAYRKRRHDSCLGEGATPETAEAVWDWRARYVRQSFRALYAWQVTRHIGTRTFGGSLFGGGSRAKPDPVPVTVTVRYYMDLLGASDNHKTDSTRQTEYTYSAGNLQTLTRTIPVSHADDGGWSAVLVDLYDEINDGQPVAMAYDLKWDFPTAGEYRMSAPYLVTDSGDRQETTTTSPYYREAPDNTGMAFKVDESWRYAQGVVSMVYNGLCNMALFVPDNAKACVVERCFDTLNVSIGAQTGQDLTSCFALSGWPITNSGEAFTYSYNAGAEEAHMKDADGMWLKTALAVSDISPQMIGTGLNVAVRCFRIVCVNGLPYTFYGTKYVNGRAHGMLVTAEAAAAAGQPFPRKRLGSGVALLRTTNAEDGLHPWGPVEDGISSDEHGYFASHAHEISDSLGSRGLWTYGVKHRSESAVSSVGRFASREYARGQAAWSGLGECSIARDAMGCPIWAACERDGDVNAYALDGPTDADLWHCPGNPALTGAAYKYASICACDDGSIIVGATNTDQGRIDVVRSRNNGTTWEAVNTAFGTGLVNGHLFHIHGQVYLVGWADDKVWLVTSSQPDLTREVMDGTNSIIKVCAHAVGAGEDAPQCSVIVDDTGQIMVAVAGDADTRFYSCRNFRTGFSLVA